MKAPLASPDASNISGSSESSPSTCNGADGADAGSPRSDASDAGSPRSPPSGAGSPEEDTVTAGSSPTPAAGVNADIDANSSLADASSLLDEHETPPRGTDSDSATSSNVSESTVKAAKQTAHTSPDTEPVYVNGTGSETDSPTKVTSGGQNGTMTHDPRFSNRTFSSFSSTPEQRYSTDLSRHSVTSGNDSVFSDSPDLQNNNPSDRDLNSKVIKGHVQGHSALDMNSKGESTESVQNRPLLAEDRLRNLQNGGTQEEVDAIGAEFVQSESDTDSLSTPTDSPAKARLASLNNVTPPPLFTGKFLVPIHAVTSINTA